MMSIIEIILLPLLGIGFVGNLYMYYRKRKDNKSDEDKILINPLIDEICNICQAIDEMISQNGNTMKTLDKMRHEEIKKYREIDSIGERYGEVQDELMKIYDKESFSECDSINITTLRERRDEYSKQRALLIQEISSEHIKETTIIRNNNESIKDKLQNVYGVANRQTNTYKLNNKDHSLIISNLLVQLDKLIKTAIDNISEIKSIPIPPPILFALYKSATACRLKLTQISY